LIDNDLYIACLNLAEQRCLVVGGGRIGLEKIQGLLVCRAGVVVVAPEVDPGVRALADAGEIVWVAKSFETSDLDGALLVIAATADTKVNTAVFEAARARSMLVNVVDVPDLCNFILPSITRRGPIAVAVSTSGASPALAKRLRREMDERMGDEYAQLAVMLDEQREWAKTTLPTYDDRRIFFESIVEGDPDPIPLLRDGKVDEVRALIAEARNKVTP
jgi:precorrin-2 dehydrogenase/sirohydrochlorin ferrochelatase